MNKNKLNIEVCPGTLAEGFSTYSPACLRLMFNRKKVDHVLPYDSFAKKEEGDEAIFEIRQRISISGVQEKWSFVLENNTLRPALDGEKGTYLLKPIPTGVLKPGQVPANEHLTMQIAKQVFGIKTAENALVFFKDGSPAYITKRFDVKPDGSKRGKEDFASLAGKSKDNAGAAFKYEYSYEELGLLFPKYVSAWKVEIEKYFTLVVFNYLFSNGDAHLKNFSLLESDAGDFLLSPAYDLLNTKLHVDDTDFALRKGLFSDGYQSPVAKIYGHPSAADFIEFGNRIGLNKNRIEKILLPFQEKQPSVEALIGRSFLGEAEKRGYLQHYLAKRNLLNRVSVQIV